MIRRLESQNCYDFQWVLKIQRRYAKLYFGCWNTAEDKPVCRNGRRCRLKICWVYARAGSSPATGSNV